MSRTSIHAGIVSLLFVTSILTIGCDTHVSNLGGGFKLVRDERQSGTSGHSHHLYYQSKDLGDVGQYFISPSGCHAIYEQNGKLMLFHACSESLRTVATIDRAVATQTTWSEVRNEARVTLIQRGKELTHSRTTVVPLSACACRIESRPLARAK